MTRRYWTLALLLILMPALLSAQKARKRNDEKECGICHVQWHPDRTAEGNLIPSLETSTRIDGRAAVVSHKQMCLSCHDGYVKDSREVFGSSNHQGDMDKGHLTIQGLPLGTKGQIYCGTCHTPHALKPNKPGGLAPFLRKPALTSDLCLNCHSSNGKDHGNHPLKIKLAKGQKVPAGGKIGPDGTIECLTCHPIHGDRPTLSVVGQDRKDLCISCHEQYFQIELTDHDLPTTLAKSGTVIGPNLAGQDVCASCHKTHNGLGKTMWSQAVELSGGKNAYCISCHVKGGLAQQKSFNHKGHTTRGVTIKQAVPALGIKAGDKLLCISCHDPHQWEYSKKHAVSKKNEEGTEYTSFLKLPDDASGQLCVACHVKQKSIAQSDHSVSREGFQQHFKAEKIFKGQCSVCHNTHGGDWKASNQDRNRTLCESCHTGDHYPSTIGGFDHPMGMVLDGSTALPGFKGKMTCTTCHDPHVWGKSHGESLTADLDGTDANSFLRVSNWPEPKLCLTCHEEQSSILGTDHDLTSGTHSACSFCHSTHNAANPYGLVNAWDENAGTTLNEQICFACHQTGESGSEKIPGSWNHPREYGTISHPVRGTGTWKDFPLFSVDAPAETVGFIDCFTCHDPHRWSFDPDNLVKSGENEEGNYMTSFLRNPSHKTLCTDCHGANTLWKFNYYHDPVKRKRY